MTGQYLRLVVWVRRGARAREVADRAAGDLRKIDVINSTTAGTIQTSPHTQTNPSHLT